MNDELLERMAEALTDYGIANASGDGYRFNAYGFREGLRAVLAVVEPLLADSNLVLEHEWCAALLATQKDVNGRMVCDAQELLTAFIQLKTKRLDAAAKERT